MKKIAGNSRPRRVPTAATSCGPRLRAEKGGISTTKSRSEFGQNSFVESLTVPHKLQGGKGEITVRETKKSRLRNQTGSSLAGERSPAEVTAHSLSALFGLQSILQ